MPGIEDFIVLSGLGLLGYGLFLYDPRIAYSVCGLLLMLLGLGWLDRGVKE